MKEEAIRALVRIGAGRMMTAIDDYESQHETAQAEVSLAREGIRFFQSNLGRYVVGMAVEQILEARTGLETVSPQDEAAIRQLQNQIHIGRAVIRWLDGAVQRGLDMEQFLKEEQRNER
ncbi:MAG: hypothetical protein HQM00_10660 [Magnetococcales bacterium]|nr:hypothetical protein [Magnetococcales bacterium]